MAPVFADDAKSLVRAAADIVEVVSRRVALTRAGRDFKGLCPFHSEKTPSFKVSQEKQFFHCFGCGVGGDVFDFVMRSEGLSFPDALASLAARYGVEIETRDASPAQKRARKQKNDVFAANQEAMEFFQKSLHSPAGRAAKQYLAGRGMDGEIAGAFSLGFAPDGWHALESHLDRMRFKREAAVKAGLLVEKNNKTYDRFRNRIVFPIKNLHGQVLGFGGRVMNDDKPKYLNSAESPVYDKKRVLYGLPEAARSIRDTGLVFVVEGYFDVLALAAAGVANVAAACGTALGAEHVRLLKGYAKEAVLVFDADEAGKKAAARSLPLFLAEGLHASVLALPAGHDPDTFVREFGAEGFHRAAEARRDAVTALTDTALERFGHDIHGTSRVVEEVAEAMAVISDPVARSLHVKNLAHRVGVDETAVAARVREAAGEPANKLKPFKGSSRPWKEWKKKDRKVEVEEIPRIERADYGPHFLEEQVLAAMLTAPGCAARVCEKGLADLFEHPVYRSIGQVLAVRLADGEEREAACVMDFFDDPGERGVLAGLFAKATEAEPGSYESLLCQFEKAKNKKESLARRIQQAEKNGDHALALMLLAEKSRKIRKHGAGKN